MVDIIVNGLQKLGTHRIILRSKEKLGIKGSLVVQYRLGVESHYYSNYLFLGRIS